MTAVWLGDRYFSMIAARGDLLFPAGGTVAPWDAKSMFYCDAAMVDHMLNEAIGERKITTAGELEHALTVSQKTGSSARLWIHEELEDLVKQMMD